MFRGRGLGVRHEASRLAARNESPRYSRLDCQEVFYRTAPPPTCFALAPPSFKRANSPCNLWCASSASSSSCCGGTNQTKRHRVCRRRRQHWATRPPSRWEGRPAILEPDKPGLFSLASCLTSPASPAHEAQGGPWPSRAVFCGPRGKPPCPPFVSRNLLFADP